MDALAREYGTTHDPEILAELKELSRRLRELEKQWCSPECRGPGTRDNIDLLNSETCRRP
jgi:hypothetical protein